MSETTQPEIHVSHRFLDESGDTTFYGRGKSVILGQKGVSLAFSLGMVKVNEELGSLRQELIRLAREIELDSYLNKLPSVARRVREGGFYFHATDDSPEVREKMFRFILQRDLSIEVYFARKNLARFAHKHNNQESEFYADILSHLLKNKLEMNKRLVLNIAERGTTTRNANLEKALEKPRAGFYSEK